MMNYKNKNRFLVASVAFVFSILNFPHRQAFFGVWNLSLISQWKRKKEKVLLIFACFVEFQKRSFEINFRSLSVFSGGSKEKRKFLHDFLLFHPSQMFWWSLRSHRRMRKFSTLCETKFSSGLIYRRLEMAFFISGSLLLGLLGFDL